MRKTGSINKDNKRPFNVGLGLGLGLGLKKENKKIKTNNNIFSSLVHQDIEPKSVVIEKKNQNEFHIHQDTKHEDPDIEDDPFESFMSEISEKAEHDSKNMGKNPITISDIYAERDEMEDYMESLKSKISEEILTPSENPAVYSNSDEEVYQSAMLADQHHSAISYPEIKKSFYDEHVDIKNMDSHAVDSVRKAHAITVSGGVEIKPCVSFAHFGLPEKLINLISKKNFSKPTPIQTQAIPIVLSGRDIIGIAKTGSGKTGAYLWPLIVHILGQSEAKSYLGPFGIILAPTRELGRLIDIINAGGISLSSATYLVLDEADKMLNMGFGMQLHKYLFASFN
ncbi:DEAD-box ATP-dependent RNA helicase 24 [Smittium mucronatum]|uniref:DEAD-box ATP-dependent RNA helicase 24 n=1 Tax=Smittium mucronatum TaxID=133383 RepID=A0A1R0GNY1_9FUNG|nr:DEAD-box ATP-dependent RNA helicase 24 [Smittium mucronatum]